MISAPGLRLGAMAATSTIESPPSGQQCYTAWMERTQNFPFFTSRNLGKHQADDKYDNFAEAR
jgi:hypothetical protein